MQRGESPEDGRPLSWPGPLERHKRDDQERGGRDQSRAEEYERRQDGSHDYPQYGSVRGAHLTGSASHARAFGTDSSRRCLSRAGTSGGSGGT